MTAMGDEGVAMETNLLAVSAINSLVLSFVLK